MSCFAQFCPNMSLNSNDVETLKKFIKTGTYFGFSPLELNSKTLNSNLKILYNSVNAIILILAIFYSLYARFVYRFRNEYAYELFLDLISECLLFICSVTVCFGKNIFYLKEYRTVFNLILEIDTICPNKFDNSKSIMLILRYFEAIVSYLSITLSFYYQHYDLSKTYPGNYMIHFIYWNYHYGSYILMYTLLQINLILVIIGKRCQIITEQFGTSIQKLIKEKGGEMEIINRIRKTVRIIRKINKLVLEVNKIFGWFIFFYIIFFTEMMFLCIFLMVYSRKYDYNLMSYAPWLLVAQVNPYEISQNKRPSINLANFQVMTTKLSFHSHNINFDQFSTYCYDLQENVPYFSHIRNELFMSMKYVKHFKFDISAASFYNINKSTLCTIFSVIVTYIIVLNQLDNNNNQDWN